MERVSTDRSLLTERVGADNAVSNRDDFLGIVSHDLRDLLGGIVTSCAIVLRTTEDGAADAPARVSAQRIQRYAARMARLIEDLTDVVSIDAGKLAVTGVRGDLATVIDEAVSSLRALAAGRNISLVPEHDTPLIATFDANRVLQVLSNLMANAIRFTPDGGRVRVSSARSDNMIKISVSDTGPGIPDELKEAIFERFRQAPSSQRRGLGLGLYISRCLIEAQHGKIWAERADGQTGATVSFTLPAVT
jgi:signal transduction histidine kinase